MSGHPQTTSTRRFITYWPYVPLVAALVMLAALFHSATLGKGKVLQSLTLQLREDEQQKLPPIELKREIIGALRIDVVARLPANQWVTYEIQLLDAENKIVATGIKQAWAESGTWSEDGESGSWSEDDLKGGLDVRANQAEKVTIAVQVLEYSDTAGQDINQPVSLSVVVRNGVVDQRYLIGGFLGTTLLAAVSLLMVSQSGKLVIAETIQNSDVNARALMGGTNRLLRLTVDIESDETSPPILHVDLVIKNRSRDVIYEQSHPVQLSFQKEEGKIEKATASLTLFFVLELHSSYGITVEVVPDAPVDKTSLFVREGARTLISVPVIQISAQSGE